MISQNCNIQEVIAELECKDYFEMIYLLEKETTEAERQLLKTKQELHDGPVCGPEYVRGLKNLIFYLRYGAKRRGLRTEHIRLLESIREKNGQPSL
jgi:hypothetical protein